MSPTEREVFLLQRAAEGRTVEESAYLLRMSPGTVRSDLLGLRKKLGVHTTIEAVAIALRKGWIE